MGQSLGQLTTPNSALMDQAGNAAVVGNPSNIRDTLLRTSANFKPFADPDQTTPATHNLGIGTPSLSQAASAGAMPGSGNALSPGLSKMGKLAVLLTSGVQGALAGRAAQEQAAIQSGGRRAGGAGIGFEAGYGLPFQHAGAAENLAQQQAQTQLLRSQGEIVNTPQGPMPGWLARYTAPAAIRAGATTQAAETSAGAKRYGADVGAAAKVQAAEIGQKYKAVPGVGLFDTTTRTVVPGTANGVTITPEIAADYQLPQDFIGKPMNVGQLASLEGQQSRNLTTVQGAEGPALVNKKQGTAKSLGLGAPSMSGFLPAATDPNNPGNLVYVPKAQAGGLNAPGSANVQAAKAAAKSEVPTKVGDQVVAFDTMIQHAQLLRNAVKNLGNGDVQALNGLKNSFKNAFGYSGPITAEAIADAYKGEVSNVINKGHITDTGNEKVAHTLEPNKQNYQTMDSVLGAYQALAQSKKDNLLKQNNAIKNPNQAQSTPGVTHVWTPQGLQPATKP